MAKFVKDQIHIRLLKIGLIYSEIKTSTGHEKRNMTSKQTKNNQ